MNYWYNFVSLLERESVGAVLEGGNNTPTHQLNNAQTNLSTRHLELSNQRTNTPTDPHTHAQTDKI